jgi:hypothetical protein
MDLGQPDGIEPPTLRRVDLLEGGCESFGLALAGAALKLVKYAEFECHLDLLLSSYHLPASAKPGSSAKAGVMSRKPADILARAAGLIMTYSTLPGVEL